ncbi:MAG: hypothetical protein K1060chlam2_01025 [Chlamydiae bacterium]|nr:hypothetical protein [Chlamydiota bacterium]
MNSFSSNQAPIPLGAASIPKWPQDIFPDELQSFLNELSASTETPLELAALSCFSILATAAQGKFCVQIDAGYSEPVNIWTSVALPSGSRKTSVFNALMEPLISWERQKKEELGPKVVQAQSEKRTMEARIKELRRQAASAKCDEFKTLSQEITLLESSMEEGIIIPHLWTADVTAETLAVLMTENKERMAILSDEAGIFDIIGGRYSNGIPNLDIFLQGHACSPSRVNRKGKPPIFLEKATLSVGLVPQPDVLQGLTKNPLFRGRGLLARFLYAMPISNLGNRTLDTTPMSSSSCARYEQIIHSILDIDGSNKVISLSPEAYSEWHVYAVAIEIQMSEGGPLCFMRDWASKLPGAIARLAGLLHICRHSCGEPELVAVSIVDIKAAIRLGHCLIEHAKIAFDSMGADPALDGARVVLGWIKRTQPERFTFRDCHYALKSRFKRAKDLAPSIEVLKERNHIFEKDEENKKPCRPSRVFLPNLMIY